MLAVADQLALVGAQRHPLGEHVVGVGEPLLRLRVGAIGEADAVLAQQLAGLGVVGDDRAVRIEQIAVPRRCCDREQAEALVDLQRLVSRGRAQQLARPPLRAALARRVADVSARHQPPAALGKKITRSAAAGPR